MKKFLKTVFTLFVLIPAGFLFSFFGMAVLMGPNARLNDLQAEFLFGAFCLAMCLTVAAFGWLKSAFRVQQPELDFDTN